MGKRVRVTPTDDWQQVELLTRSPEQRAYELIRPVVLFGRSPAERAQETGAAERALYRQADRFDQFGMQGLFTPVKVEKHRRIPEEIRRHLLALKAEHPAFRVEELVQICTIRFGRRLSHHTFKRLLAEGEAPPAERRRFLPYHQIVAPTERRLAVIRRHAEGWRVTTIAAYLQVDRTVVCMRRSLAYGTGAIFAPEMGLRLTPATRSWDSGSELPRKRPCGRLRGICFVGLRLTSWD